MSLRLGRLVLETHRRALHITRGPKPNCRTCNGEGAVPAHPDCGSGHTDYELCDCWDPTSGIRIPFAPRPRRDVEVPF